MLVDTNFSFYGEYATMAKFLTKEKNGKPDSGIGIFARALDCYLFSAAIGISKDLYIPLRTMSHSDELTVFAEQLMKETDTINYLFTLAMLNYKGNSEEGESLSLEERMDRAFRVPYMNDSSEEAKKLVKKCEDIFTGYVYGGVKYIFDFFKPAVDPSSPLFQEDLDRVLLEFVIENLSLSDEQLEEIGLYH